MGNATEAWDDSGTIPGVASDPTSADSPLFVLDETVDNVGIAMQPLAAGARVPCGCARLYRRNPLTAPRKVALPDNPPRDRPPQARPPLPIPSAPAPPPPP